MAQKHAALIRQFPEYKTQIEELITKDPNFEGVASEYERLREDIHAQEATGRFGPDYTNLCDQRDSLQEILVEMMQKAMGS